MIGDRNADDGRSHELFFVPLYVTTCHQGGRKDPALQCRALHWVQVASPHIFRVLSIVARMIHFDVRSMVIISDRWKTSLIVHDIHPVHRHFCLHGTWRFMLLRA